MHTAQLMPLPLTVSCFSKIQIGFTFLVQAHPGSPGQTAPKRVCVCVASVTCCVSDVCTVQVITADIVIAYIAHDNRTNVLSLSSRQGASNVAACSPKICCYEQGHVTDRRTDGQQHCLMSAWGRDILLKYAPGAVRSSVLDTVTSSSAEVSLGRRGLVTLTGIGTVSPSVIRPSPPRPLAASPGTLPLRGSAATGGGGY